MVLFLSFFHNTIFVLFFFHFANFLNIRLDKLSKIKKINILASMELLVTNCKNVGN